jgi:hypothetical protein
MERRVGFVGEVYGQGEAGRQSARDPRSTIVPRRKRLGDRDTVSQ